MGYFRAGFDVTGVDIHPQKRYPFRFVQDNALEYLYKHGHEYDFIHASPPCQFAAQMFCPTRPEARLEHRNLIPQTRALLRLTGKPYVIENVKGARKHLIDPIMLHGSMFNLPIFRDRYFEMYPDAPLFMPAPIRRDYTPVPINSSSKEGNKHASVVDMAQAMNIDWMTKAQLRQAIPPAYTHWLGLELLKLTSETSRARKVA
jgi:DNA (cytosine-5)-methyltransferase 1